MNRANGAPNFRQICLRLERRAPAPHPFSVAQIANLLYRRLQIGRPFAVFRPPGQGAVLQDGILRYSAARRSRNQYDPTTDEHGWTRMRESLSSSVLICVYPWLKKSSRAATISGDTDRLTVCATNTTKALNRYSLSRLRGGGAGKLRQGRPYAAELGGGFKKMRPEPKKNRLQKESAGL